MLYNFTSKNETKCECGKLEDMEHIYECEQLNSKPPEISFRKIFEGNLKQQIEVYKQFAHNIKNREKMKQISHPSDNWRKRAAFQRSAFGQ